MANENIPSSASNILLQKCLILSLNFQTQNITFIPPRTLSE